jgi:hypothetical protein
MMQANKRFAIGLLLSAITVSLHAQERPANMPPLPSSLLESMKQRLDPLDPEKLQRLLIKPEVQVELEIDRSTYSLMRQAASELQEKSMELMKERAAKGDDPSAAREFSEKYAAIRDERRQLTQEALNEVFPPKTYERLQQIAYQIQIQEAGLENALVYGRLADEINFTDAQWEKLAERAAKLEAEKQEKLNEIVRQYDEKLLGYLTYQQREKYRKLVGEPFEYSYVRPEQQSFDLIKKYSARAREQPQGP